MLRNKSGFALLYVFFFVIMLAGIVVGYLFMNSQNNSSFGYKQTEAQVFYAAEAGQARAVQYLQNDWAGIWAAAQPATGALGLYGPVTENLGTYQNIAYDFIVDNWNLAYSGNPAPFSGVTTQRSSAQGVNESARAIDGVVGVGNFWRSQPPFGGGQWVQVDFPAGGNYSISECRFRSLQPGGSQIPATYSWLITPAVGPPTTIGPFVNAQAERYDFFPPVANVISVRLSVAAVTAGASVRIDEIEIPWIRIKTRCRITAVSGTSYTEKYIRSCVLTSINGPGATITKIVPSTLSSTQMTAIWDEISSQTWTYSSLF